MKYLKINKLLAIFVFIVCFKTFDSFISLKSNKIQCYSIKPTFKNIKHGNHQFKMISEESGGEEFKILRPPPLPVSPWSINYDINKPFIIALIIGQAILLNVALGLGFFSGVDIINWSSFSIDSESLKLATGLGLIMYAFGALIDRLPYNFLRQVKLI